MEGAFTKQKETPETQQQQHQLKQCVPLVRLTTRINNKNPFSILRFWVSKSLQSLHYSVKLSEGSCSRRTPYNGMVINNSVFYAEPEMEGVGLIENNGCKNETFTDLVEQKGGERCSSSEFLSSEMTGLEEQSQSSAEDSSSPLSMGWPVQEIATSNCTSSHGSQDEEKKELGGEKFEKQGSILPGIQCVFNKFSLQIN